MKLLQNALRIEENGKVTYLNSFLRHDFVTYEFKDKSSISIDGGCSLSNGGDYVRRLQSGDLFNKNIKNWSLTTKDNFQKRANRLLWGHYEKPGCKGEFKYSLIKDLPLKHLYGIEDYLLKKGQEKSLHYRVVCYWIREKEADAAMEELDAAAI